MILDRAPTCIAHVVLELTGFASGHVWLRRDGRVITACHFLAL